jgi:hypothetical protein
MSLNEPPILVLRETGVTALRDGTTAVNVGPIVAALNFLTEGRGEDRGTDEHGRPLPDLMSLAFDVVQAIILGGRKAEFFRRVKLELDAFADAAGQSSLMLAKRARRVERPAEPTALDDAADRLQALLGQLSQLSLDEEKARDVQQALEAFREFGADRWVSATAQLLVAAGALTPPPPSEPAKRQRRRSKPKPKPKPPAKPTSPPRAKPRKKAAKKKPAPAPKTRTKKTRRKRA